MKKIFNFLCLSLLMGLSIYFAACKKNETKFIDWKYPDHLKRDSDLFGTWYNIIKVNDKLHGYKFIYQPDGRYDAYRYDDATKTFSSKNISISDNGKQSLYWSAENGVITLYDLAVFSGDKDINISTYSYRLSISKDSLYYTEIDNIQPSHVRKMP